MSRPVFNLPNVLAVAGGLAAGLILANYLRTPPETSGGHDHEHHNHEPEVMELGEPPEVEAAVTHLPPIALPDLKGEVRELKEWYGRPMIVNFWATWCAPCRREMPLLQLTHDTAGDLGPQVIGIAVDRTDDVISYVAESGYTYPMVIGQQEALDITEQFGFDFLGLPLTIFAAADGEILKIHIGEVHAEQLQQYLMSVSQLQAGEIDVITAKEQMAAVESAE